MNKILKINKSVLLIILILTISITSLTAEETTATGITSTEIVSSYNKLKKRFPHTNPENYHKKALISYIATEIDGATQRKSLLAEIKLKEGNEYDNFEDLVYFMNESIQDLVNMRVFESVEYAIVETSYNDSITYYTISLLVKDSLSFFPFPTPKYDSNNGFKLGVKFFYFNMFGTLTDFVLSTNLYINKNETNDTFEIPAWSISPEVTGFSLWGQDFSLQLSQSFETKPDYDDTVLTQQYSWHSSRIKMGTTIFLPLDFYYSFGPSFSFNYGIKEVRYDIDGIELQDYGEEKNLEFSNLTWNHSIGFNNIDWIGNFRDGFSAEISNSLTGSLDLDKTASFSTTIGCGATFFWRINKTFNLSGRARGIWSNKEMTSLGSNLRGVKDGFMRGYIGAFANLDMNISIIDWDGVGEIQVIPFFEIGIVDREDETFDLTNDFAYTTGLDLILYIDKLKGLHARATFAIDLSNHEWSDWKKKYELQISSQLSY